MIYWWWTPELSSSTGRSKTPYFHSQKGHVKTLIEYFEANPILHYTPRPIPSSRNKRTKIIPRRRALKGYTKLYEIDLKSDRDALVQLQNTRLAISRLFNTILNETKGFKFVETLRVTFVKKKDFDDIDKTAYFNSRAQIVLNSDDFLPSLQLSQQKLLKDISVWLSEGSGWTIDRIDDHYINIVVYDPLKGNSYIPLSQELNYPRKGLVNLENDDNECFSWCHIRFFNPQDKEPMRTKTSDKTMVEQLNYDGIEFPVATKHYGKIEEQNSININVFGYENKQFYPIYVSKQNNKDVLNLLLITKDENKRYVLIKYFKRMMYNKTKHKEKKHFCTYCL